MIGSLNVNHGNLTCNIVIYIEQNKQASTLFAAVKVLYTVPRTSFT